MAVLTWFRCSWAILNAAARRWIPALRLLVSARIAQLCHCEFCNDITQQDLAARQSGARTSCWRSPTGAAVRCSAKKERLALAYAEAATQDAAGGG